MTATSFQETNSWLSLPLFPVLVRFLSGRPVIHDNWPNLDLALLLLRAINITATSLLLQGGGIPVLALFFPGFPDNIVLHILFNLPRADTGNAWYLA